MNYDNFVEHESVIYINILSLCDGLSCGYMAFLPVLEEIKKTTGKKVELQYWAVEIDKFPRELSDSNFEDNIYRPCNDVNEIGAFQMLYEWPAFDYVIFGSPCQSVSVAGNNKGLGGSSGLLLKCMEILALAKYRNPKVKFIAENVKMSKKFKSQFDKIFGLFPILINSSLVSAQNRERYYWNNFKANQPNDRKIVFSDILEDECITEKEKSYCIDANYHKGAHLAHYIKKSVRQLVFKYSESNRYIDSDGKKYQKASPELQRIVEKRIIPSEKSLTLMATGEGCGSFHKSINLVATKKELYYRKLTVRECARLQTIPEWFDFSAVSKTQGYKAIGNGWTVDVITHIFRESLK